MLERRLSRRRMLRSAATGALLAPLLWRYEPFLTRSTASAGTTTPPKRVVFFWNPQGNCSRQTVAGVDPLWPDGGGTSFGTSRILRPLEAHKGSMLLLRGFNQPTGNGTTAEHCGLEVSDGAHGVGAKMMLTPYCPYQTPGDPMAQWGGGRSLDQVIADQVGEGTFRRSILLAGSGGSGGNHRGYINYAGVNEPIAPIAHPLDAYRFAFGESVGLTEDARTLALRARRGSALDLIRDDIRRVRARLPVEERPKMDIHLESVATLERELDARFRCDADATGYPARDASYSPWADSIPLHMRTIAASIACDQARVFSLMAACAGGDDTPDLTYFDPTWTTNYHSTGHASGGNEDGGGNDATVRAHALETMIRVSEYYATQVAQLCDALRAIPEADGTSAFDNTVIVWCSEMGDGNHNTQDWPFVILGGGWHFTQGYYHNDPLDGGFDYSRNRYGNILTAVAQSMGLAIPRFGDPQWFDENLDHYAPLWRYGDAG
jgi:hypothetical protein